MSNQILSYNADTRTSHAGLLLWLKWVLASVVGFAVGGAVAVALGQGPGSLVYGGIAGAITGTTLVWLMSHSSGFRSRSA